MVYRGGFSCSSEALGPSVGGALNLDSSIAGVLSSPINLEAVRVSNSNEGPWT